MGCVHSKEIVVKSDEYISSTIAGASGTKKKETSKPEAATTVAPLVPLKAMAPVVAVVYYSTYGHIKKMADTVAAGLREAGVEVKLYQVPETLSEEVLNSSSYQNFPTEIASIQRTDT